uniref:Uncharacterized protein n=1 Tax=Edwardsiella tarda TaxID=636 RepID=Q4G4B0_EDWTA|nr:hypothetical protein [Edwardsiella tarda]
MQVNKNIPSECYRHHGSNPAGMPCPRPSPNARRRPARTDKKIITTNKINKTNTKHLLLPFIP